MPAKITLPKTKEMAELPERWRALLEKEYLWPTKGDRLLRDAEDRYRGVDFSRDVISRHALIWIGYMKAGAVLIEACQQDPQKGHSLVYPILFNYRHAVELAMKWIVERYGHYSGAKIGNVQHHNLWQLWKVCKKIIVEVGSDDEAIYVIEQVVKDFHDLDKRALAFRYSRDNNGALIALPDRMIDLENIRNVMEAVDHFFTGADGQLHAHSSAADW